jgi:hypothetical protein
MKTHDRAPLAPATVARRLEELRALLRLARSLQRARRIEPTGDRPKDGAPRKVTPT